MMNARETALAILQKNEKAGQYTNIALDHALQNTGLSAADRSLVSALVLGVTERRITLDYYLSSLTDRPLTELDTDALYALRMGLYQLIYMDRIPPHAAIYETVNICRKRSRGFVNAVLRTHTRRNASPALPSVEEEPVRALSVRYSVCEELASKMIDVLGAAEAECYFAATLQAPLTTLRVNTAHVTRDALASRIPDAIPTPLSPHGLKVSGAIRTLPGFAEGDFFVQDEASQLCVEALGALPGDTVIDACSCPGSKSFGAAMNMQNKGKIYSFDLHKSKLSLVVSSARRLGILTPEVAEQDARMPREDLIGIADRVLCDVPCSGFGVLAKKPELRYKSPEVSGNLPTIQSAILNNCATYVKEGGTLVYSTCTVLPEENERVISAFLESHPEFTLTPFVAGNLRCDEGMITLYPHIHQTDGFFIAKLQRKSVR